MWPNPLHLHERDIANTSQTDIYMYTCDNAGIYITSYL